MRKYVFIAYSNPVEGQEDTYNEWFNNRHLPDMLDIPGVYAAQRFAAASTQIKEGSFPWKYMAQYEIETDDISMVVEALKSRIGTEKMRLSNAISSQRDSCIFYPVTERVEN